MKKRWIALILLLAMALGVLPVTAAADAPETERTIMMYLCGSNLESEDGFATHTLKQILAAPFSAGGKVRFLVMTGGATQWFMENEYLYDPVADAVPAGISTEYNQVWEVYGVDADVAAYRGKMVLVDADGPTGTLVTRHEGLMSDPTVLKGFIDFAAAYAPAKRYDLILWDHGDGPLGAFALDWHETEGDGSARYMSFASLLGALGDNAVTRSGKFDFINFDACLMNGVEMALAMADFTDCYIASPEFIPAYSEVYGGWLKAVGKAPDMGAYALGKIMVDDYVAFYNQPYDDGGKQEGALAVVNLKALVDGDFLSAMTDLNGLLETQLKTYASFYDELRSVACAIEYGGGSVGYRDLGNLAAYLGCNVKEGDGTQDQSAYFRTTARLLTVLHDPSVIYAKGTQNIRTADEPWVDETGEGLLAPQGTSGMYIYFPGQKQSTYAMMDYYKAMDDALAVIPAGARRDFLTAWRSTALDYHLLYLAGKAVTALVNEGTEKGAIDYDAVKNYWKKGEDPSISLWGREDGVLDEIDRTGGEAAVRPWLERVVLQLAHEAVYRENAAVYTVDEPAGTGYQIRISDTQQRAIDSVSCNLLAEIPAVEKFLNSGTAYAAAFKDLADWGYLSTEFPIGTIRGEREISSADFDDYGAWLNSDESTWNLAPADGKWYAVQDANGTNHLVTVDVRGNEIGIPAILPMDADDTEPHIVMVVFDTNTGNMVELYSFVEGRGGPPSALKGELTVTPISLLMFYDVYPYPLPISAPLKITAANAGDIRLTYTGVENIPDIQDIDGDGDILSRRIVVKDIYGSALDLSVTAPVGELTSIEYAEIQSAIYTGAAQLPQVVTAKGKTLTEGVDYKLFILDPDAGYIEPGEYIVGLEGLGDYTGYTTAAFVIRPYVPPYYPVPAGTDTGKEETPEKEPAPSPVFVDVDEDAYYYEAVLWAVDNGITTGSDATHFSPNEKCSRAQMVTFLWRAAGCPEPAAEGNPFTDVDEDAYYYKAVLWAAERGITLGTGEGKFSPAAAVTRGQTVTFLYRALEGKAEGETIPFDDVDEDAFYAEAVQWAAENGITLGTGADAFSPDADCLRAQIVTFLYRAYGEKR